jgi:hypothetical protein
LNSGTCTQLYLAIPIIEGAEEASWCHRSSAYQYSDPSLRRLNPPTCSSLPFPNRLSSFALRLSPHPASSSLVSSSPGRTSSPLLYVWAPSDQVRPRLALLLLMWSFLAACRDRLHCVLMSGCEKHCQQRQALLLSCSCRRVGVSSKARKKLTSLF